MQPTFEQMSPHVWFDVDDFTLKANRQHSLSTLRFYLLSRAPFYQMEKYTFISLYYLHIVPAHLLFHLNTVFPHFGK